MERGRAVKKTAEELERCSGELRSFKCRSRPSR